MCIFNNGSVFAAYVLQLRELQQQKVTLQRQINTNQREEKKCETQLMKLIETVNTLNMVSCTACRSHSKYLDHQFSLREVVCVCV